MYRVVFIERVYFIAQKHVIHIFMILYATLDLVQPIVLVVIFQLHTLSQSMVSTPTVPISYHLVLTGSKFRYTTTEGTQQQL